MGQPPERRSPQDRRSRPLDRYKPYLLQRWNEGIRNSRQLWRELVAQGYQQSSGSSGHFVSKRDSHTNSKLQRQHPSIAQRRSASAL